MSFTKPLTVLSAMPILAAALTLTATASAFVQVDKTAIKAGKVITLDGEPIENGILSLIHI